MEKKENSSMLLTKHFDFSKKRLDAYAILSFLSLLTGIVFYVMWGITYRVWLDVGIYAPSAIFISLGVFGLAFSFIKD